jgi:ABC-2 type transport system permease protein
MPTEKDTPMQSAAELRAAAQSRVRWELLANLVRKDLKVKYKGSALGFVWSLANPLLYLAVFTLVFNVFLRAGVPNFAVHFMAGMLCWNFFLMATGSATGSVVGAGNLVKKVPFPRIVLPLATVGFAGVQSLLQFGVFLGFLLAFYRDFLGQQLWLVIPALAVLVTFTMAVSLLVASLNVIYRDVQHLYELMTLAWFWLNPIVYPVTVVRDAMRGWFWVYMLNPTAAVITSMQRAIYVHVQPEGAAQPVLASGGYGFYVQWLAVAGVVSVVLLALGLWTFRHFQRNFAEEL